jgi:hypothetical protein
MAVRSVTLVKWPRGSAWRSVMEKNTSLVSSTGASGASTDAIPSGEGDQPTVYIEVIHA